MHPRRLVCLLLLGAAGCPPAAPALEADGSSDDGAPASTSGDASTAGDASTTAMADSDSGEDDPGTTASMMGTTEANDADSSGGSADDTTGGEPPTSDGFVPYTLPCVDVSAGETITDFIPLQQISTCVQYIGPGAGRIPVGMNWLDTPGGCQTDGEPDETKDIGEPYNTFYDRLGVWVFLIQVNGTRDEVDIVPHCYSRDEGAHAYDITVQTLDGAGRYHPAVRWFTPGENVTFGTDSDPVFQIENTDGCNAGVPCNEQNVGEIFTTQSPLGDASFMLGDFSDEQGFDLWMQLEGGILGEDRPYAVSVDMTFCLEDNENFCAGESEVATHGRGVHIYSALFLPR